MLNKSEIQEIPDPTRNSPLVTSMTEEAELEESKFLKLFQWQTQKIRRRPRKHRQRPRLIEQRKIRKLSITTWRRSINWTSITWSFDSSRVLRKQGHQPQRTRSEEDCRQDRSQRWMDQKGKAHRHANQIRQEKTRRRRQTKY